MKKIFTLLSFVALGISANAQIVINEVYGGGGGGTAVYINDYVELVNIGSTTQTLNNASIQYASASGTFNSYNVLPSITLSPGQKYLIEMVPSTANTTGAALPTADYQVVNNTRFSDGQVFAGGYNMSASNGKVALVQGTSGAAVQATGPASSGVLDYVGYGTATTYEGTGAAPALDATKSAQRKLPLADTNNNANDFEAKAPTPENKASLAVGDVNKSKINLVKNTIVKDVVTFGAKANVQVVNLNGQVVKSASVENGSSLNVSSLSKGIYIVKGDVNGETVSQKIIKQ